MIDIPNELPAPTSQAARQQILNVVEVVSRYVHDTLHLLDPRHQPYQPPGPTPTRADCLLGIDTLRASAFRYAKDHAARSTPGSSHYGRSGSCPARTARSSRASAPARRTRWRTGRTKPYTLTSS